jgi:hypothetical protein
MAEVRSYLDLSTAHLRESTRDMLDEMGSFAAAGSPPSFMVAPTGYGWFVSASPADNERNDNEDVPDDLWAAMTHAKANGADHILFDRDAGMDADLPTYEDGEEETTNG